MLNWLAPVNLSANGPRSACPYFLIGPMPFDLTLFHHTPYWTQWSMGYPASKADYPPTHHLHDGHIQGWAERYNNLKRVIAEGGRERRRGEVHLGSDIQPERQMRHVGNALLPEYACLPVVFFFPTWLPVLRMPSIANWACTLRMPIGVRILYPQTASIFPACLTTLLVWQHPSSMPSATAFSC